jgi:hypothetical protein
MPVAMGMLVYVRTPCSTVVRGCVQMQRDEQLSRYIPFILSQQRWWGLCMDALLLHTAHTLQIFLAGIACVILIELAFMHAIHRAIHLAARCARPRPEADRRSSHGRALAERQVGHGQDSESQSTSPETDLILQRILPLHECMRWKKEGEIDRYVPDQRLTNHNSQMGSCCVVGDCTSSASNDHIYLYSRGNHS